MKVDERIGELRAECDNYNRALQALKALTHELLWDSVGRVCFPNSVANFGRRMHTTATNTVSPDRRVTPDMVAQRGTGEGTVVELKASMPQVEEYRRQKIADVRKYDDELDGWARPLVGSHDLILLVDYANSQIVKEDVEAMIAAGDFACDRPFALVYFSYQPRADATWIALHLIHGQLSDATKQATLHRICLIHPENIEANPLLGSVLLYDARPPLPLLMIRLYESLVSNLDEDEALRMRTEGQVTKTLSLTEMKALLADYCCPVQTDHRVPSLPETAWLKATLRVWIDMDWALKSPTRPNSFDIILKKNRREPFEQFLKVCAQIDCKLENKRQKELLKKQKLEEQYRRDFPLLAMLDDQAEAAKGESTLLQAPASHPASGVQGELPPTPSPPTEP